jgi:protein TonB
VIKKPIEAKIVEEIKAPPPPPPPPKQVQQQPQRIEAVQQPYVPPPDIPVTATQTGPTISAVTSEAPTQPYVIAPPAPTVVAPPPPPKPAVRRGIARLSGDDPSYPREAIKAGVAKGHVVVRLQIDEKGNVIDVNFVKSDPPRVFDRAVSAVVKEWKFHAEGEKYVAEVEFNFTLKDE